MHNNHLREAQYIKIDEKKKEQKQRIKLIQRIVSSVVVLFCVVFLIMGGANLVSATSHAYLLEVDGEEIATFVSEKEAEDAIELCFKNINDSDEFAGSNLVLSYVNDVEIKQVSAAGVVYSSSNETAAILQNKLDLVAEATAINIGDTEAIYVADDNEAIDAVNNAKNYYADPKEDPSVVRVYTSEEITISKANVSLDEVLSTEQATNMLLFGSTTAAKASSQQPLITVNVERTKTQTEALAFETIKQENASLSRGEENVITEGVDGVQEVTYKVQEVNGVVIGSEEVSSNVLVEAIDEVVEVGVQYYVASRSDGGGNGTYGWPVDGVITSRFGWRSRGWHSGLDIAADLGTTIFAANEGTVIETNNESGYGLVVRIDHGDGMVTVYAHCGEFYVEVGDTVDRNTPIAAIGMTGTTTGPHVHFEIRVDGQAVNPLDYL